MRGAKVGLLITKGYRAVQEVQNQARDGNLFDYFYAKPQPIAPQSLTREIPERSDYAGNVLMPLDRDAVRRAARELKDARRRLDRGLLPVLLHEPGARGDHARDHPRGISRRLGVAVERGAAAHPRMGAAVDDAAQRLSRAGAGALHRPSQPRPRRRQRRHPAALPDAVERRRDAVHRRDRRRPHRAHAVLRPGRRRAGERLSRRATRRRAGLVTLDMGGTSADIAFIEGGVPLETHRERDRAPADRRAGARHDARSRPAAARSPGSTAAASSMSGRKAPAPIPAPPATGAAARGRPSPTPTWSAAISIPDYFLGGSQTLDVAASRKPRCRSTSPARSRWTCSKPPSASSASSTCAWPTRCGCSPPSAASISRPSRCCRSAAPARCMPPRSPRSSACGASWCRRGPARSRRSGCSAPTWCTTTSAPSCKPLADVTPEHAEDIFRQLEAKARDELKAEGMDPAAAAFLRELDLRYTGQGYELRTSLDGLFTERLTAAVARRRARTLRRAPRADPRPRRQGAAGRGGELSPARARRLCRNISRAQEATPSHGQPAMPRPKAARKVHFGGKTAVEATLYERDRLDVGAVVTGPAIVEQFDATTVIPPAGPAAVDGYRNLDSGERREPWTPSPSRSCATRSPAWSMRCTIISIAPAIPPSSASRATSPA